MTANHQFGDYSFDSETGDLNRNGNTVRLEPTVSRLLLFFLENPDRVISREELIEKVWFNRIVSDDPINRCVSVLRHCLDEKNKHAFIETVPRKGYMAKFPAGNFKLSAPRASYSKKSTVIGWGTFLVAAILVVLISVEWIDLDEPELIEPTIAVLPFSDLSPNKDMAYLSEGISDTVIHLISRVEGLNVTAKTSSFALQNKNLTIAEIAAELGVEHVLEGSLQVYGDDVRIIARLVEASTESEVWSSNFNRKLADLFSIQDDIASAIVIALKGTIIIPDSLYKPKYDTYELVLKGKAAMNSMTSTDIQQAENYFRRAMSAEPDYYLPYILLARKLKTEFDIDSYNQIYPGEAQLAKLDEVKQLITRSIELNPLSSEAHNLRASMLVHEGQSEEAGKAFTRAIELAPNNSEAIADYANWLMMNGQIQHAVISARKAATLDPRSSRLQQILAQALWTSGRSEEALGVVKADIRVNPVSANNYGLLGRWSLQLGRPGLSMLLALKEKELDPNNPNRQWGVCLSHFQLWDIEQGIACADRLLEEFPTYYEALKFRSDTIDEYDFNIIESQIELYPNAPYYRLQLADWFNRLGRYQDTIRVLKPVFPSLFTPSPRINDWSIWGAQLIAHALLELGNKESAIPLIEAALAHLEKSRKMQGGGFSSGINDVLFLALLGRDELALNRLEQAINANWSFYSFILAYSPILENFALNPRFQSLVKRHEKFMSEQRQWYKNKLATNVDIQTLL